ERARRRGRLAVGVLAPAGERAVRLDAARVEEARADPIEGFAQRRVTLAVLVRAPALDVMGRGDGARVRVANGDIEPTGPRRRLQRGVVAPTGEVATQLDAARLGRARAQLAER